MTSDVDDTDALATARQSLHGSEERFRLLVEQVTEYAIFLLDPQGRVSSWNLGAARIKGYDSSEIIGRHFSKFYRPEDRWKCDLELQIAERAGRVEDEGYRVRKDGSLFWANVVITCLRDLNGGIVGFAKVTRDMTERRKAAESLRQSEERLRLIVESVKDYAIIMLDDLGHVSTWSPGAEGIYGYQAQEIMGQHVSRFLPDRAATPGQAGEEAGGEAIELQRARRDGRFEDEGWRVRKDGSRFWANLVVTALRDTKSSVQGFALITRDLTERHRAEEARLRLGQAARERINILSELAVALAGALSVEEVSRIVAEKGTTLAQADTCTVYLLNERTGDLELFAERGCNPAVLPYIQRITPDSGQPTYAIGAGQAGALWVETAEQYAALIPSLANLKTDGPRAQAFWCVPLVAERRTLGMLGVGFHRPREFSDEERDFVATFARHCAQSIARARRLEAERAAAALADRLRASLATTLRSIGDALIATDQNGAITMMNGVAEALTDWTEAEARGHPLPDVFHVINEHTRQLVANPVERVLETGGVVGLANHTVLISRAGREIPIEDSGAPIRNDRGAIEGVVLVFRDVSERKHEESRQAFLADATSVLAGSLDYEQTVAQVAQLAVPRLADWCAVDLIVEGERAPRRLAVAHVDPAKVHLAKELNAKYPPNPDAPAGVPNVLRTGRSELYPEIPDELLVARCVNEDHLHIARELGLRSALMVPLMAQGRVLGAMSFIYSTSGRTYTEEDLRFAEELARRCANAIENARAYRAEQKARRGADIANRAKDEFLAIVSHELRTPLNAIMGWAKMLTTREFDERRGRSALETIERNAIAMAQLIEDLLDMSRVISGKLRIEVQQVEVARVVDAAIESIRPAAFAKGIELVTSLDRNVPAIMGDPTRLQQIVWNLLSNAVKFSPKGGRVQVLLRESGTALEVSVTDDGKGIAPEFLPHVFDAFRQEDASPSRSRGGLGLGLAITRQLVELHGGQIIAHSEGEGRGATFSVFLPYSVANPVVERAERATREFLESPTFPRPEHIRGLRVLAVDDDEDARHLVATILEECGCSVTMADSVEDGMRKFQAEVPDILLSDVAMPGEDGYELIRRVRALPHHQGGDVPAAALTAYARAEDRRSLLNAGYSIHLPKPIEPAELVAVVATLSRFLPRAHKPES
ncbi:MAG TPA: PAS domain S-box protein [Polyangiaceae bacterium]|nr:PAS domain S-box protein [Polyangiaceae bacterium]